MSRNLQFQVLRGTQGQFNILQSGIDPNTGLAASPLGMGEMFFTLDTGNLFFGTPGIGIGYIQLGDTTGVIEQLKQLTILMEAVRRALVVIATDGKRANDADFDPGTIARELGL